MDEDPVSQGTSGTPGISGRKGWMKTWKRIPYAHPLMLGLEGDLEAPCQVSGGRNQPFLILQLECHCLKVFFFKRIRVPGKKEEECLKHSHLSMRRKENKTEGTKNVGQQQSFI